jgi:hypothetical protein
VVLLRGISQLREEPALPDPGRALDEREPSAPAARVSQRSAKRLELAVSLEEELGWASVAHLGAS